MAFKENVRRLYKEELNMFSAENFCIEQGGHLASIGSTEEQAEFVKVMKHNPSCMPLVGRETKQG